MELYGMGKSDLTQYAEYATIYNLRSLESK